MCKLIRLITKENKIKKQEEETNNVVEQNPLVRILEPKLTQKEMYVLAKSKGEFTEDKEELLKIREDFHRHLYESKISPH